MTASRLVPLAGVAAVVLVVIAFIVAGEAPNGDDPIEEVVSFYTDNDTAQIWGSAFLIWGVSAFLLFAAGLWRLLRAAETERHGASALVLVGAAVFAVGAGLFAGVNFTLGDFADDLDPIAVQALNALNEDLFAPLVLGVFAFFVGAGASIIGTGTFPKWLGWVAVVLGIVALTPVGFFSFLLLGVWILVVSALIFFGRVAPASRAP